MKFSLIVRTTGSDPMLPDLGGKLWENVDTVGFGGIIDQNPIQWFGLSASGPARLILTLSEGFAAQRNARDGSLSIVRAVAP